MVTELDQIYAGIKEAKKSIKKADILARLKKNQDFQTIITEGYQITHAANIVQSKATYATQDDKSQKYIDNQIAGIGALTEYLNTIFIEGVNAVDALESHERERDILISGEDI